MRQVRKIDLSTDTSKPYACSLASGTQSNVLDKSISTAPTAHNSSLLFHSPISLINTCWAMFAFHILNNPQAEQSCFSRRKIKNLQKCHQNQNCILSAK